MRILISLAVILFWQVQAFAGWQIVTSNTFTRDGVCSSNLTVLNIQGKKIRSDAGVISSVIVFADQSAEVQLFHANKTYHWQAAESSSVFTNPPPFQSLPTAIETNFDGYPAKLYCFTNQPEQNCIWVAPISQFVKAKSSTNAFPGLQTPVGLSENHMSGTSFDTNSIIVGTEYTTVSPLVTPAMLNANGAPAQVSNVTFTTFSKLVSITETNFPPAEFEVPQDYTEGNGMPEPFQMDPSKFGRGPIGGDSLAGIRQAARSGQLILVPPPYSVRQAK